MRQQRIGQRQYQVRGWSRGQVRFGVVLDVVQLRVGLHAIRKVVLEECIQAVALLRGLQIVDRREVVAIADPVVGLWQCIDKAPRGAVGVECIVRAGRRPIEGAIRVERRVVEPAGDASGTAIALQVDRGMLAGILEHRIALVVGHRQRGVAAIICEVTAEQRVHVERIGVAALGLAKTRTHFSPFVVVL